MRLSARVDYALRAASELAAADAPRTVEQLSTAQHTPNSTWRAFWANCAAVGCSAASAGPRVAIGWLGRRRDQHRRCHPGARRRARQRPGSVRRTGAQEQLRRFSRSGSRCELNDHPRRRHLGSRLFRGAAGVRSTWWRTRRVDLMSLSQQRAQRSKYLLGELHHRMSPLPGRQSELHGVRESIRKISSIWRATSALKTSKIS